MKELDKLSDEQVVEKVREKDKELYEEIIKRYEDKLMRYAQRLVSNRQAAADVVQEAFIKAYVNLRGFKTSKKFSSWIYRIAHNEAMDYLNKNKKTVRLEEEMDWEGEADVEDEVIRKELKKEVHDCLGKIAVKYREPLTLYFLEDKSYEEISDILKVPMGTVGTRIRRGKLSMKKQCGKIKK